MGPEGGTSPVETGASVGPTVEAPVSQPEVSPGTDSSLDALEERVGRLQLGAETEGAARTPAVEPITTQPTFGAEGLVQEPVEGVGSLGQAQGAEAPAQIEPEQKLAPETEARVPTEEVPKVPGKVANDPEYKKTWGDLYAQAKQQGGEVDVAEIDRKASSEYYDNLAKTQLEKGLPDEVKKDLLYQQELGEALTGAQDRGEPLDANKLSQEALAKFQQEKDLQAEKAAEPQAEQLSDTDKRLQELEQKLNAFTENPGSKLESAQVTLSAKDLLSVLKALAEAKEPNQDQKKKENKLILLLKLLGLLGVATVAEAGSQVKQETTRQTR